MHIASVKFTQDPVDQINRRYSQTAEAMITSLVRLKNWIDAPRSALRTFALKSLILVPLNLSAQIKAAEKSPGPGGGNFSSVQD